MTGDPARLIALSGDETREPPDRMGVKVGATAALVVVLAVVGFLAFDGGGAGGGAVTGTTVAATRDDEGFVAGVEDLAATSDGDTVHFSWEAPDSDADNVYVYELAIGGRRPFTVRTDEQFVTIVDAAVGIEICLHVAVEHTAEVVSPTRSACVTP